MYIIFMKSAISVYLGQLYVHNYCNLGELYSNLYRRFFFFWTSLVNHLINKNL